MKLTLGSERPVGVVYTPASVVAPMVRVALEPLLRGASSSELEALRLCDFAVGEGAFVVGLVAQLAEALLAAWRVEGKPGSVARAREVAASCVIGVDIDARAIEIARASTGCRGLRVGDALALDWRATFPPVFARGGFDAVVGNPPYVRQELVAAKHALGGWETASGGADLYVYFFELACRILRPGGRYCLITPNKWLTVEYGRGLRAFLAGQRSVEAVVDVSALPIFDSADAFPCITWGRVGGRTRPRGHRAIAGDVDAALRERGAPIAIDAHPWHLDRPETRALIDRLERRWPALGDVLSGRPARGVVTGCNRAFVIDRATRDRLNAADPTSASLIHPFVKGRDLRRWRTSELERFVLLIDRGTEVSGAIRDHLVAFRSALEPKPAGHRDAWTGRKSGNYRWHELQDPVGALAASPSSRLVYQDIQTGPACALIAGGVVPDTTVWILPTHDRYLLAVLNSSLYGWYARQRFPPALNGSVRPKLAYLRALPIATPSAPARAAIETLVEQRLRSDRADLDPAIDRAILDVYELSRSERALLDG